MCVGREREGGRAEKYRKSKAEERDECRERNREEREEGMMGVRYRKKEKGRGKVQKSEVERRVGR